ncbi:peptidylprolyl isomerase [candidate division WOR-3 bacterium]|nr:peptidylprolyl isomerase [candidate division WOR-3 bacterium]
MQKRFFAVVLASTMILVPACKKEESTPQMRVLATMKVQDKGSMVFELDPAKAPKAVEQFTKLAKQHQYDGLLFFHVSKDGVIQSGCPFNDGSGTASTAVQTDIDSGYQTARGDLVMRAHFQNDPTAVSSQFLIFKQPVPREDGKHPFLGKLIEGHEVLDSIHIGDTLSTLTIEEIPLTAPAEPAEPAESAE